MMVIDIVCVYHPEILRHLANWYEIFSSHGQEESKCEAHLLILAQGGWEEEEGLM